MRQEIPSIPAESEYSCTFASAITYKNLACPGLALLIMQSLPDLYKQHLIETTSNEKSMVVLGSDSNAKSDSFDWSQPVDSSQTATSSAFDWSQPVSSIQEPSSSAFDWSQPVSTITTKKDEEKSSAIDWGEPVASSVAKEKETTSAFDWSQPETKSREDDFSWGDPIVPKSSNIDDEYEQFKKSMMVEDSTDNLDEDFDLEEPMSKVTNTAAEDSKKIVELSQQQLIMFKKTFNRVYLFQLQLAMQLLVSIHRSVSTVSRYYDILKADPVFEKYYKLIGDGLISISTMSNVPVTSIDFFISQRCKSMDSFVSFNEIPRLSSADYRSPKEFSLLLVNNANLSN